MVPTQHELKSRPQVVNLIRCGMVNLDRHQVVSSVRWTVVNLTEFSTQNDDMGQLLKEIPCGI